MLNFLVNNVEAAKKICGAYNTTDSTVTSITSTGQIVQLVGKIVSMFQIAIPIILVVVGLISLGKAVVAGKDDEVKKATSGLIKKVVFAAAIFFIIAIIKLVLSLVGGEGMDACWAVINDPWKSYSIVD